MWFKEVGIMNVTMRLKPSAKEFTERNILKERHKKTIKIVQPQTKWRPEEGGLWERIGKQAIQSK